MAANDNMQGKQFGPDAYKAERMAILYQRSLRDTSISSVTYAQPAQEEKSK